MVKKNDINYPAVSIIFPNFNGGKEPLECLFSITNLNYPKNKIEIIIIDNASTDGSLQKIKNQSANWRTKLKIIENKENLGFVRAINQGIKQSTGNYVFIGNDDVVFEKNSLKNMVEYMEKHPSVAITGGKIFLKTTQKIVSCGYMMNHWTGNIYPAPNPQTIKEPDWVQGCAMLIKKSLLRKIGLLDDNFSLIYFEDFDICLRATKTGHRIIYLPAAHFWHGQSTTMDKNLSHKYYQWYKNKIRFVIKNLPTLQLLSILLFQTVIVVPYRLIILRDRRFLPFIKGFLWNIEHITETLSERRKA